MGGIVSAFTSFVGGAVKSVVGAATDIVGSLIPKPKPPQLPSFIDNTPSAAASSLLAPDDPSNGTAQAERDAAAEAERKRLAGARGYDSTNPTGGAGDLSTPNLASKSLLGQ